MAAAVTGAMIVVTGAVALVGDSMSKNWVPDCVATANGSSHSPSAVRVWSPSAPPNVTRPASSWFGVLGTVGLSGLLGLLGIMVAGRASMASPSRGVLASGCKANEGPEPEDGAPDEELCADTGSHCIGSVIGVRLRSRSFPGDRRNVLILEECSGSSQVEGDNLSGYDDGEVARW